MKRMVFLIFLLAGLAIGQNLVPQFKKTVCFIYVLNNNILQPQGTAFLVSIPGENDLSKYIYLVTDKHVIYNSEGLLYDRIFVRFNNQGGTAETFKIDIGKSNEKTFYFHKDPTIDLVVMPIVVPQNIDYKTIPISQIIKRSEYIEKNIDIGTDVFFTGLFLPYMGSIKINPITRFGRLSLIPNERINFAGLERDILLMESATYGGNSGSPVIFSFNTNGRQIVGLGGVVLGSFNEIQIVENQSSNNTSVRSSLGISAITPSEFILDILNSPELVKLRALH